MPTHRCFLEARCRLGLSLYGKALWCHYANICAESPRPCNHESQPQLRLRKAVMGSQTVCLWDVVTVLLRILLLSPHWYLRLCASCLFSLFLWIVNSLYPSFLLSGLSAFSSFTIIALQHLDPAAQHSPGLIFCHSRLLSLHGVLLASKAFISFPNMPLPCYSSVPSSVWVFFFFTLSVCQLQHESFKLEPKRSLSWLSLTQYPFLVQHFTIIVWFLTLFLLEWALPQGRGHMPFTSVSLVSSMVPSY